MKRRVVLSLVVPAMLASLGGCTTVESKNVAELAADPSRQGLTYFLPTRMMRLTATRTAIRLDAARRNLATAETGVAAARKAAGDAKAKREDAEALLKAAAADLPAAEREELQRAFNLARVEQALAETRKAEAETALRDARTAVDSLEAGGSACSYSARAELLPPQADPDYRFIARPVHSALRDDSTKLSVTSAGLLTSANVIAADRTGDIIVEIAGAIAGLGAGTAPPVRGVAEPTDSCEGPRQFVAIFDPLELPTALDDSTPSGPNKDLADHGFPIRLSRSAATEPSGHNWVTPNSAGKSGALYYRSPVPVKVTLHQSREGSGYQPIDGAIVMLPQAGPVSYIPMNSSAFVRTVNDVQFTDGAISSWNAERPSEVLEVVRLPVRVLTAIISVPAQIFSLRIDRNDRERALIESQQAEIEKAERWRIIQACLDRAVDDAATLACLS